MEKKILIVEDSDRLNEYISSHLQKEGYKVFQALNGRAAFSVLKSQLISLVILDINLGDINGLDILKTLRRQDKTLPVIIVSSIGDNQTKIEGFNIGCDDYITKPFYIDELIMRVKRMLVRQDLTIHEELPIQESFTVGIFEVNINTITITKNGKPLSLRKKQFDILVYLMRHKDTAISAEMIISNIWGNTDDVEMMENSLYVQIRQIRSIIEEDASKPVYLQTVRNAGYIFKSQ